MTKEQALEIIKNASDALSHASYAAIVGCRVSEASIQPQWGKLRELIEELDPDNSFVEKDDPTFKKPTLSFVELNKNNKGV